MNQSTSTSIPSMMMNSLRQIARALSVAEDLDTTLDLITLKTTELMSVDSCSIYLRDKNHPILRLRASTGLNQQSLGRATLKMGEGMTGVAAEQGIPVYAADAQHNPYFKRIEGTRETLYSSLLAVPLIVENHSIGALNVQTVERRAFKPDEVEMVALIGDLAAGAIYKAQLYDKQKEQIEEFKALAQVSEVVTSPKYLDDMLNVVTEMAARSMNAAVCTIFLLDESGQYLELRSMERTSSPYAHRQPLDIKESTLGRVAQTGKPIYIKDVRSDDRYIRQDQAREEGLVSLLAEPLSVRDHVIGVLACYTNRVRNYSTQSRALFATLANQTALAIENARLVTNAAIVREMHHRIKNNLQTVAMLMQLQIGETHRLNTREALEISISRIQSIAAVHELLSEQGFHLVDVANVLQKIADSAMTAPDQAITIAITGDHLSLPSRSATALALVVNELILNSIEHGFKDRAVGNIDVAIGRTTTHIIVTVIDNGRGLPEEYSQNLGLELIETLVSDDLQGKVVYRNNDPGTEVTLHIPREIENRYDI